MQPAGGGGQSSRRGWVGQSIQGGVGQSSWGGQSSQWGGGQSSRRGGVSPARGGGGSVQLGGGGQSSQQGRGGSVQPAGQGSGSHYTAGGMPLAFTQEDFLVLWIVFTHRVESTIGGHIFTRMILFIGRIGHPPLPSLSPSPLAR